MKFRVSTCNNLKSTVLKKRSLHKMWSIIYICYEILEINLGVMSSNTKFCIIKSNLISQWSEYSFSMHFGDGNLYPSPGKWWSTRADQGKRQIWSSFRKPSTSSGIHSSTLKNPTTGSISIVHWTISFQILVVTWFLLIRSYISTLF